MIEDAQPTPGTEIQIQYAPQTDVVGLRIRPHLAIEFTEAVLPADTIVLVAAQITVARAQAKQQGATAVVAPHSPNGNGNGNGKPPKSRLHLGR